MRTAVAVAISCVTAALPGFFWVEPSAGSIVWHRNTECPALPDVWGCAYPPDKSGDVHIYLDPSIPHEALDDVAWHEAAHAYDFLSMTDATRERWLAINRPGEHAETWWDGIDSAGEQFAESYRICLLGQAAMPWRSYHYTPTRRTLKRTCKLIGGLK